MHHTFSLLLANTGWIGNIDPYFKFFTAVMAGLAALIGLPVAVLQIKKTGAEIRKLELENRALQAKLAHKAVQPASPQPPEPPPAGAPIILPADPRYLAPLLLLINFVIALGILTLSEYALSILPIPFVGGSVELILYLVLFLPVLREAYRLRRLLHEYAPKASRH